MFSVSFRSFTGSFSTVTRPYSSDLVSKRSITHADHIWGLSGDSPNLFVVSLAHSRPTRVLNQQSTTRNLDREKRGRDHFLGHLLLSANCPTHYSLHFGEKDVILGSVKSSQFQQSDQLNFRKLSFIERHLLFPIFFRITSIPKKWKKSTKIGERVATIAAKKITKYHDFCLFRVKVKGLGNDLVMFRDFPPK